MDETEEINPDNFGFQPEIDPEDDFCDILGVQREVARRYLNACGGILTIGEFAFFFSACVLKY